MPCAPLPRKASSPAAARRSRQDRAAALDKVAASVDGDVAEGVRLVQIGAVAAAAAGASPRNAGADPEGGRGRGKPRQLAVTATTPQPAAYREHVRGRHRRPGARHRTALANAASVATLILTTETLIGDLAEDEQTRPPAPALGGGCRTARPRLSRPFQQDDFQL